MLLPPSQDPSEDWGKGFPLPYRCSNADNAADDQVLKGIVSSPIFWDDVVEGRPAPLQGLISLVRIPINATRPVDGKHFARLSKIKSGVTITTGKAVTNQNAGIDANIRYNIFHIALFK